LKMSMKPLLCDHNTYFSRKHCFYALFYRQSSFASHLV
jgi:hypothetical protein